MAFTLSGCVLWSADHETGTTSQWTADGWGRIAISSTAEVRPSTTKAHSGRHSLALTIRDAAGGPTDPGVRMVRDGAAGQPLPADAYYGVWYYLPQRVEAPRWWNVYQWKRKHGPALASDLLWTVNITNRADGAMRFTLKSHVDANGDYSPGQRTWHTHAAAILPVGRWVHLECRYRWSLRADGQIVCWQDGKPIFDVGGAITDYDYPDFPRARQWTVNNYSNWTIPSTQTIYIDDARIATSQQGPTGAGG